MRVVCSFMSLEVEYLQIEKDKSDVVLHRTRIFNVVGKMRECLLDVLTSRSPIYDYSIKDMRIYKNEQRSPISADK